MDVGSALSRKLWGARVNPFAVMGKVILTSAFSSGTFLIRMDLAVSKAGGCQRRAMAKVISCTHRRVGPRALACFFSLTRINI